MTSQIAETRHAPARDGAATGHLEVQLRSRRLAHKAFESRLPAEPGLRIDNRVSVKKIAVI